MSNNVVNLEDHTACFFLIMKCNDYSGSRGLEAEPEELHALFSTHALYDGDRVTMRVVQSGS